MDPQFKKFKLVGHVYLWHFGKSARNYPGWNISFDDEAIECLLMLFDRMDKSAFTSEVMFRVFGPTIDHLQIVNRGSPIKTVGNLILRHVKTANTGWSVVELHDSIQICFDAFYLEELRKSLLKVKSKEGDFAICDAEETDGSILYFWWSPRIARGT